MKAKNPRPLISSEELLGKPAPIKASQHPAEGDEIARWTEKLKKSLDSNDLDLSGALSVVGTMSDAGPGYSKFVIGGQKKKRRGQEWHEQTHGTNKEKQARWAEHQAVVDRLFAKNPNWSWAKLKEEAAKECGVNPRTIHRHCTDPRV